MDGDAASAVGEVFDAGDLADVLLVERITGNVIRKRDEDAHAFVEERVFGEEIDAIAGNVFGGGGILEVGIAGIGGADLEWLADANTAAAAALLLSDFMHIDMTTRKWSLWRGHVLNAV